LALNAVLASKPTALRIAREMQGRRKKRDHMAAYLMMCLLDGPEIEAELNAWLGAEKDSRVHYVLARHRKVDHLPPPKAALPSPEPAIKPPITEAPVEARLAALAELWARVLTHLEKRRAIPAGPATPGDIARHADAVLGHREVSRFVFEYYYPAIYDGAPVPPAAKMWVEQLEDSA
jgi:hypothetical protein